MKIGLFGSHFKISSGIFTKPHANTHPHRSLLSPQILRLIPQIRSARNKYYRTPGLMTDRDWMLIALGEALKSSAGWGKVGAVLVKDGKMIGLGQSIGSFRIHAEHDALKNAGTLEKPELNKGAVLYVTYQPCNFRDRTVAWKSCCDYIKESGIATVVFASPDPRVGENGIEELQKAGILVKQISDIDLQSLAQDIFNLRDMPVPEAQNLP
jgi:pyrimidine deaminase RibD-like protein